MGRDRIAALVRLRAVADEVAEAPELVRLLGRHGLEHGLEGVPVTVDIGDDGDAVAQGRHDNPRGRGLVRRRSLALADEGARRPPPAAARRLSVLLAGAAARSAARYSSVGRLLFFLAVAVQLAVLAVLALLGRRLARGFALGEIGAGVMIGVAASLFVTLATLPVGLASLWWDQRYGITKQEYWGFVLGQWSGVLAQTATVAIVLAVVMSLARRFPRGWWAIVAPLFVAVGAVFVVVRALLAPIGTHQSAIPRSRRSSSGWSSGRVPHTKVRVDKVSNETRAVNGETTGVGPTTVVVLWDTLFKSHLSDPAIEFVTRTRARPRCPPSCSEGPRLGSSFHCSADLPARLGDAPPRRLASSGGCAVRPARCVRAQPAGDSARERRFAPLRVRGRLDGSAGDARPGRRPRGVPQLHADRPGPAEPARVVIRLARHPPNGDPADRDDGRAWETRSSDFGSVSGRFLIPSRDDHFDHESSIASNNSRMNRFDMFTRATTTPGTSPLRPRGRCGQRST